MALTKLNNDIKRGTAGEQLVQDLLDKVGIRYKSVDDKNRAFYDLVIFLPKTQRCTLEVKYDYYQEKSGNFAIEVFNTRSNKKSGLSITKADFWVHILGDKDILLTPVGILKDFCRSNKPTRKIEKAGDNNARIFLYKKDLILPIFVNIQGLSKSQLLKVISSNYAT